MKIRYELLIFFSISLVIVMSLSFSLLMIYVEESVMDDKISQMGLSIHNIQEEIEMLDSMARGDLLFTLKNPHFKEYFELPETKEDNIYNDKGVLQFSENQYELKEELEKVIYHFQNKFQVDEACLIDSTGQEHTRLVLLQTAPDNELSPDEEQAPFFDPSFEKNEDEVYMQYTYVSPDTERDVFAYTTPIVLEDGQKPAFFHFEMPMMIFEDMIDVKYGNMLIIDSKGTILVDSEKDFYNISASTKMGLLPTADALLSPVNYNSLIDEIKNNESEFTTYNENDETHYVMFSYVPEFDWFLVYDVAKTDLFSGNVPVNEFVNNMITISVISIGFGIGIVFLLTKRITKPITVLAKLCREKDPDDLTPISITTKNEVGDVASSINSMIGKISIKEKELVSQNEEMTALNKDMSALNEEIVSKNEEIRNQNEKLKEIDKMKSEFMSMVSHELKTPIMPILSWCSILQRKILGDINDKQQDAVSKIKSNAIHLSKLIGDVLDVHKIEMNKLVINLKESNVKSILDSLNETFENETKENRIKFEITCPEDIVMYTDGHRIEQVLTNFVNNAIDFVPRKEGKIEINVQREDQDVIFSVKDNGIGVPLKKQKDLFKKFYQVDSSVTRSHGGSGLGLSICKGIIQSLHGEIGVTSKPNQGSTFFFKIPIKTDDILINQKV